ncbi:hypothetical protein LCGC14_0204380 [marine sediment metagenome]|uniref:FlgO domain-containing protein n=1 Tax=marine sediment metagenome TaxID=412755 RepID=A0A0F9UML4_9ZZZZ|nr:hypothetical protein [Phycisphaerae bacterium]HDZ44618.1 hypothetical protein [Phycisphaerae bacterium]
MKDGMRKAMVGWAAIGLLAAAMWLGGCEEQLQVDPETAKALEGVKSIAVVPFVDAHNAAGSGELVVTAAMEHLYTCPDLRVYERAQLKALIDEHDLLKAMGSDQEVAAKIGQLTGVDAVILGEVTQYEAQAEAHAGSVGMFASSRTKYIHRVGMFVRAVRIRDGRVIYAHSGEGVSPDGYTGAAGVAAKQAFGPWVATFRHRAKVEAEKQAKAEQARANAERARAEAEIAKAKAEKARAEAEIAKAEAEKARAEAETK